MIRIPFLLARNLFALALFLLSLPLRLLGRAFRPKRRWVHVNLQPVYPLTLPMGIGRWMPRPMTFLEFHADIERLTKDQSVEGVLFSWEDGLQLGPASLADIADAIKGLKVANKRVLVHADQYTTLDFPLANAAHEITMTPAGRLYTFAPHIELIFLGNLFEKLGILPQFIHIGAFKTATHRFLHESAPQAQRLMMTELLENGTQLLKENVGERNGAAMIQEAPLDARKAALLGLIDAEVNAGDISRYIEDSDGHSHVDMEPNSAPKKSKNRPFLIPLAAWKEDRIAPNWKPLFRSRRKIAVVDLSGVIVAAGMHAGANTINPNDVLPLLDSLKNNLRVTGVILHINSPGGSALSSELIWHAIMDLRKSVPVVAWCTDVAASGGYYLACAADAIVCRPESVMGSIGVIMGKFTAAGAAEKLGVGVEPIGGSSFLSLVTPIEGPLLENLKEDTRSFYRRFLDRVGQSRGIARQRIHRYARGRVYLGREAHSRGLVDGTGGFREAIERIQSLRGLPVRPEDLALASFRKQDVRAIVRDAVMTSEPISGIFHDSAQELLIYNVLQKEHCLAYSPLRIKR